MSIRPYALCSLAAGSICISTPAHAGSVADLPEPQRQTATCMVAVLHELPEVSEPLLLVSDAGRRVLIHYYYHHKDKAYDPAIATIELNVTNLISGKQTEVGLGGLSPKPGLESLDEADSGMLRITDLWRKRCGLKLSVFTD